MFTPNFENRGKVVTSRLVAYPLKYRFSFAVEKEFTTTFEDPDCSKVKWNTNFAFKPELFIGNYDVLDLPTSK